LPSFESDGLLRTLFSANASPRSTAQCVVVDDLVARSMAFHLSETRRGAAEKEPRRLQADKSAREPDVKSAAMDSFLLPGFFAMIAGFFGLVSLAWHVFVAVYVWKTWQKVRHLPG